MLTTHNVTPMYSSPSFGKKESASSSPSGEPPKEKPKKGGHGGGCSCSSCSSTSDKPTPKEITMTADTSKKKNLFKSGGSYRYSSSGFSLPDLFSIPPLFVSGNSNSTSLLQTMPSLNVLQSRLKSLIQEVSINSEIQIKPLLFSLKPYTENLPPQGLSWNSLLKMLQPNQQSFNLNIFMNTLEMNPIDALYYAKPFVDELPTNEHQIGLHNNRLMGLRA